jgi:hypothetical protein
VKTVERIALLRSEEQLEQGRWRYDGEGRAVTRRVCALCSRGFDAATTAKICQPCRVSGGTAARCACGERLTRWDQVRKGPLRNMCQVCRKPHLKPRGRRRDTQAERDAERARSALRAKGYL